MRAFMLCALVACTGQIDSKSFSPDASVPVDAAPPPPDAPPDPGVHATIACPTGGDYCGDNGVGGPAGYLFHCTAGQIPTSYTQCHTVCLHEPNGVDDICANGCSAAGSTALQWEANQLAAGNSYSDLCLGFANQAYRHAGETLSYMQQYDAYDALLAAEATGHFVPWNGSCPCGAILFWGQNACNGNYGHVVLCTGDGDMSTAGWPGFAGTPHMSIAWMSMEECGHAPAGYILP